MDGRILRPMYVLVAELEGMFPQSKPQDPPNIEAYVGKTADMSKADLRTFYSEVFWPSMPPYQQKVVLLIDSWTADNDHILSDALKPEHVDFRKLLIPDGCTGKIQPLDVSAVQILHPLHDRRPHHSVGC